MSRSSASADVWAVKGMTMDELYGATRNNMTARDRFDEYQDRRAIEGALSTSLYFNDTACAKQPALGVDDLIGAGEYAQNWINPPQCYKLSPEDLGWERRESSFASRRDTDNAEGPAVDRFLADASLGWSDVMDVKGDGGVPPMRLARGVTMTTTKSLAYVPNKGVVDHNMRGRTSTASAGAIAPTDASLDRGYAAMFERSRVGGGPAAYNVRPGTYAK